MDLTAVEGLSDLIRAETEAQRKQALGQAEGVLGALYNSWAHQITHARAMVEAELDFSDEEDIPGSVSDRIWPQMKVAA
jgi:tRNA modification GTPase